MEAFWTAMTQVFWWTILVVAGTSLIFMLVFLFWAICNELDKEKLAKQKKPADQCKWPTGDEG